MTCLTILTYGGTILLEQEKQTRIRHINILSDKRCKESSLASAELCLNIINNLIEYNVTLTNTYLSYSAFLQWITHAGGKETLNTDPYLCKNTTSNMNHIIDVPQGAYGWRKIVVII